MIGISKGIKKLSFPKRRSRLLFSFFSFKELKYIKLIVIIYYFCFERFKYLFVKNYIIQLILNYIILQLILNYIILLL